MANLLKPAEKTDARNAFFVSQRIANEKDSQDAAFVRLPIRLLCCQSSLASEMIKRVSSAMQVAPPDGRRDDAPDSAKMK
jgi:hypothetical protein